MSRARAIALLTLVACGPMSNRGQQPPSDGRSSMAIMPQGRNQLVRFDRDPDAPPPPDIGVALRLPEASPGRIVFRVGEPVPLSGAFQGDRVLLETCHWNLTTCVQLTLTRFDRPSSEQVALVTPILNVQSPNESDRPNFSPSYRESGQFSVDLKAFFELAPEPGRYAIRATIGDHKSQELRFDVLP